MSAPPASNTVHFGEFVVDLRTGELLRNGTKIRLQVQPFQVLALLLQRPGELVTREELREKLWPEDTFVDFDDGLNTAIRKLRQVLGDSPEHPKYIETLPRRGYRSIAEIEVQSPADSERAVSEVPAVSGARRRWMLWAITATLAGLVVLLLALDAGRWQEKLLSRTTPVHIRSIAVLPLENLSRDAEEEYFADGMTEALTTDLGRMGGLGGLRVISRTSTMRYKGNPKRTVAEIAHELNVDAVVEGAVLRSGNRVRVTAQLIQALPEKHLWAETYERDLQDILTLQTDIARAIANEVQVKLTPQEQVRLLPAQPVDPQTYELYLRGRYFWGKRSLQKSIDYYQQAIERQPRYALAYAVMAEAYVISDLPPKEAYSKAKAAARTALQMDEGLAEGHNALAMCLCLYDWDWAGCEKEFQRAIALNPNYAMAHLWYGNVFLKAMGREAGAELKRAHELDPLSLITGGVNRPGASGNPEDRMIEHNLKKLELDPNFAGTYWQLGWAYTQKGMYQEAIVWLKKGLSVSGEAPGSLSALGYTYAVSGNRAQALKTVKQLVQLSKRRYVSPYHIARVYVGLDEKDLVFYWLEKAFADRSIPIDLKVNKQLASLRSDPRFQDLVRRIGLP